MLDLITEEDSTRIIVTTQGLLFLDHNIVHFSVQVPSSITKLKSILYRKTNAIDMDLLIKDILLEIPHHRDCSSPDEHVKLYNSSLREIMDKHAPLKKKIISDKPKIPWFNNTAAEEIKHRRKLEKIWQKNITYIDKYLKSSTIKGEKPLTSDTGLRNTSITQNVVKINTTTNRSSASTIVF